MLYLTESSNYRAGHTDGTSANAPNIFGKWYEILCNKFYTKLKFLADQSKKFSGKISAGRLQKKQWGKFSGTPSTHIFVAKYADEILYC